MINLERAKSEFIKYTDNYDKENEKIVLKISHSFRVMELSKKIAESLELSEEQIYLATLIGLLHDIGRFEQMKRFGTYVDFKSVDHGDLGVQILSENLFIRNFIDINKFDKIIFSAIKNHNKFAIEENLTEEEELFCKIIRDADKLDILYESTLDNWFSKENIEKAENSPCIREEYMEQIREEKLLLRKGINTQLERIAAFLAFVFDFNFEFSFKYTYENDFINKIIDRFNFKNQDAKNQIYEARDIVNKYIERKIN